MKIDLGKNRQDELLEIQKKLEVIADAQDDEIGEGEYIDLSKSPRRLKDYRDMYFQSHHHKMEQDLYWITHNFVIDIKLEIQSKTRSSGERTRYATSKVSDKVYSYDALQRKYKVNSLKSLELRYRKLILVSFDIANGFYDFGEWVRLVSSHQSPEEIYQGQYGELKEAIRELISKEGSFINFYKKPKVKRVKVHPNNLERFM